MIYFHKKKILKFRKMNEKSKYAHIIEIFKWENVYFYISKIAKKSNFSKILIFLNAH